MIATVHPSSAADPAPPDQTPTHRHPLYPRLLRLRHLHPSAWQRAVFGEGAFFIAALLVMADVASAWTLLAVPAGVATVVKFNDLLVGALRQGRPVGGSEAPGDTDGA